MAKPSRLPRLVSTTMLVLVALSIGLLRTSVGLASPAEAALDQEPFLMREAVGASSRTAPVPCQMSPSLNGNCASRRWYDVCSGHIMGCTGLVGGEGMESQFGGPGQPCVKPRSRASRIVYNFRNITPGYDETVDVFLDRDDGTLAAGSSTGALLGGDDLDD